jgi:hypothetical protein
MVAEELISRHEALPAGDSEDRSAVPDVLFAVHLGGGAGARQQQFAGCGGAFLKKCGAFKPSEVNDPRQPVFDHNVPAPSYTLWSSAEPTAQDFTKHGKPEPSRLT